MFFLYIGQQGVHSLGAKDIVSQLRDTSRCRPSKVAGFTPFTLQIKGDAIFMEILLRLRPKSWCNPPILAFVCSDLERFGISFVCAPAFTQFHLAKMVLLCLGKFKYGLFVLLETEIGLKKIRKCYNSINSGKTFKTGKSHM